MAMDPKLKEEFKKQSLPLVDVSEWYGQRYLAALREPEPVRCRPFPRGIGLPIHQDHCVEMTYVFEGEISYMAEGRVIVLEAGDLLFIGRQAAHGIRPAGADDLAINFYFRPDFLKALRGSMALPADLDMFLSDVPKEDKRWMPYLYFKTGGHLPIHNLAEVMLSEVLPHFSRDYRGSPAPLEDEVGRAAMSMLFRFIARDLTAQASGATAYIEQEALRTLYGYIDEHYQNASLSELARLMNCSESAASRQIRKLTGSTFTELVQNRRFERARWFLEDSMIPVSDIAAAVGYENFSYFYRRFRQLYGCSPNRYRQLYDQRQPGGRNRRGMPADM